MRSLFVIPAFLLFAAHAATAAAAGTEAQCAALKKVPYPAHDYPLAAQGQMLKGCSASDLYYGIRQKQDFTRARHCALSPRSEDDVYGENAGVLMMLYANGEGVPRNFQLAKKAACEADGARAELAGRLAHLSELEAARKPGERIDYCDDITSGMMMGYCASLDADRADIGRDAALEAMAAGWSAEERSAFQRLRRQAGAFVEARGRNEVDINGTARGAFIAGAEEKQRDAFLAALKAFERGKLPRFTEAQYADIDRELNAVYGQLRRMPDPEYHTVKMADIQTAQRVWLHYRDAWVEFGKVRYPAVPAHAWRAHFTRQRTAMLKALLEERR